MLSKEQAAEMVQRLLDTWPLPEDSFVVSRIDERLYGWIFFYTSRKYLETRDIRYAVAGNGPIIVNKHNGDLVRCGTSGGFQRWIDDYEKTLGERGSER
jgi:hypothetical protein